MEWMSFRRESHGMDDFWTRESWNWSHGEQDVFKMASPVVGKSFASRRQINAIYDFWTRWELVGNEGNLNFGSNGKQDVFKMVSD